MNKLKNITISIIATLTMAAGLGISTPIYAANAVSGACSGLTAVGGSCNDGGSSLSNIIKTVTDTITIVVGAISVIVIIFAGFRFITGGSDPKTVESARNMIIYAVVGLIIVSLSYFIVHAVVKTSSTLS